MRKLTDKECRKKPTPIQYHIMNDHEFIAGETQRYLFHANGTSVYVECDEGWVEIVPEARKKIILN